MERDARQSLDELLARLRSGDRSAFDPAYELIGPVVMAFIRKGLSVEAERDDAFQNTMLRVFGRVSDYQAGTDPHAWVLTLAAFEVATLRKRSAREHVRQEGEAALTGLPGSDDLEASVLARESLHRLEGAVAQLSASDQRVLLSVEEGPRPPRERKQKQRALERLRQLWRALNGDD